MQQYQDHEHQSIYSKDPAAEAVQEETGGEPTYQYFVNVGGIERRASRSEELLLRNNLKGRGHPFSFSKRTEGTTNVILMLLSRVLGSSVI